MTSRQIRSRPLAARASALLFGALSLLVAGCGPKPTVKAVSVDLERLGGIQVSAERVGVTGSSAGLASTTVGIPAFRADPAQAQNLDAAWTKANKAQVAILVEEEKVQSKEPLDAYRATLKADIARQLEDLRASQAGEVKDELAEFQAALQRHADDVGWDRVSLAWRVGFPDPDPTSQIKPSPRNIFAQRNYPAVVALRSDISDKEAAFDKIWKKRLVLSQAVRDAETASLSTKLNNNLELEVSREAERLRTLVREADVQIQGKPLPRLANLASQPAVQSTLPGATVSMPFLPPATLPDSGWTTKARLGIFLAQNNYRLVSPGEKGTDATEEFKKWLRQYEVGS